jgi:hypothetical protein
VPTSRARKHKGHGLCAVQVYQGPRSTCRRKLVSGWAHKGLPWSAHGCQTPPTSSLKANSFTLAPTCMRLLLKCCAAVSVQATKVWKSAAPVLMVSRAQSSPTSPSRWLLWTLAGPLPITRKGQTAYFPVDRGTSFLVGLSLIPLANIKATTVSGCPSGKQWCDPLWYSFRPHHRPWRSVSPAKAATQLGIDKRTTSRLPPASRRCC